MCTALSYKPNEHYFGRTLDLDRSYGEEVCLLPRRFPISFRNLGQWKEHFAILGMATVAGGFPLLYDGVNEHGLAMAGLNFPGNAVYHPAHPAKDNAAPFELIPWILGQCKTVEEAAGLLARLNVADISFSEALPSSPLHWMLSDKEGSVVVESMADGLHVYQNPAGVMTNNPPFEKQLFNLRNYRHLRADNGENHFSKELLLESYCQGLGALGLPGDVSSMSRFVRIAFGRAHSVCGDTEAAAVGQFFHLLGSVSMNRGICLTEEGTWDITVYTSCMNTARGLYYYTTYDNRQISCVDMHKCDLDGASLSRFPLTGEQQIRYQN